MAIIKNVVQPANWASKDIIKIDADMDVDLDALGYIDSGYHRQHHRRRRSREKRHPELPETVSNVIKCKNPRCITTIEQELPHVFKLTDPENGVYRCIYCDTKAE